MKLKLPRENLEKQPINVRVPRTTRKRLMNEVVRLDTTIAEIVRCALDAYFDELDRQREVSGA